jgi:hypothetical protein
VSIPIKFVSNWIRKFLIEKETLKQDYRSFYWMTLKKVPAYGLCINYASLGGKPNERLQSKIPVI